MARPLMQHGVGQLEEMFANAKADPKALKQLERELQYRQVPRAVALLAEVQAAMYGGAAAPQASNAPKLPWAPASAPASVSQQPDLWERPATPLVVTSPSAIRTRANAAKPQEPLSMTKAPATLPTMPLEDAYKALKATPGATWESIEQTRRSLVQQSHPLRLETLSADKRTQALVEANRVNAAYAALSQARCGER